MNYIKISYIFNSLFLIFELFTFLLSKCYFKFFNCHKNLHSPEGSHKNGKILITDIPKTIICKGKSSLKYK